MQKTLLNKQRICKIANLYTYQFSTVIVKLHLMQGKDTFSSELIILHWNKTIP